MKTKRHVAKLALMLTATAGLLGNPLQASVSDNRLWREQVSSQVREAPKASVHNRTSESGSWFLREIVNNQLGRAAKDQGEQRYAARLSVGTRANWFLSAVSPVSYDQDS